MSNHHLFDELRRLPPERRWRQQQQPMPVVAALIQRRQPETAGPHFLLIRRRFPPYAGQWALVGGKMEFGETLSAAALREVKEETGLTGTFTGLKGLVNERLAAADPETDAAHFLIFVVAVDAARGQAQEQSEGAVAWFTLPEIERFQEQDAIVPTDYAVIRQFGPYDVRLPYYEAGLIASGAGIDEVPEPPRFYRFERHA